MKLIPILVCMLITLIAWGAQSSFLLLVQKQLGPWKTMFLYAGGFGATACIVGIFGCQIFGKQPDYTKDGLLYGVLAGVAACLGGLGITLAFMYAGRLGNHLGSTWIAPGIGGLLPIFYVVMAVFLLPKPENGWGQLMSPGYLSGIFLVVLGVVLLTINRPK